MLKKPLTGKLAGNNSRWCLRVRTGIPSNDNGTIMPESQKTLQQVWNAIVTTIKSEDHFWHFWDELLSDVCQLHKEGSHALNTRITALINQWSLPMMRVGRHWKLWSSSMQWGTMKPGTESGSKTSPSWPTMPFSPIDSCSRPSASSTRRPRRRARQTSPPFLLQPPKHHHPPGCPHELPKVQ